MVAKLTRLTHKIAIQVHIVAAVPFAVLAPGSHPINFWIHPRIVSNGRVNVNGKLERMWREEFRAYFMALLQNVWVTE
jgi:hypothetical protein